MVDKQSLLDRLAAATGPDRGLDAEISVVVYGRVTPLLGETWLQVAREFKIPPYTKHIEAALTLVPKGMGWRIDQSEMEAGGHAYAVVDAPPSIRAATPALALCIAALRARGVGEG